MALTTLDYPLVQYHLLHYAEPSADPLPATSVVSSTILPLGPGTLTHNSSGVPVIVACTKADLIDEGNELTAGPSGMGGMVKGKGGEWEERTDTVMQVLRTICLKCKHSMLLCPLGYQTIF
jgi:dynein light intermediate chain 1